MIYLGGTVIPRYGWAEGSEDDKTNLFYRDMCRNKREYLCS